MKLLPALLLLSATANAALAWLLLAPSAPPTSAAVSTPPVSSPSAAVAAASIASLSAIEPANLRDRLLALGFPRDAVLAAVRAQLEARRLTRLSELRAATPALPWWQGIHGYRFTPEQERELRELRLAERTELTRLFGPAGTVTATEVESYLFLPSDKAARLAALERDYSELRAQFSEIGPVDPAALDERKRLLAADRERDLAALLTAEERTALELRQSPTARNLASRFDYFAGTEAQYRAIYDLQKSFNEKFPLPTNGMVIMTGDNRSVATAQLATDLQLALGPEQFAAWQLTQRADYRTLTDLSRRFGLTPATVETMSEFPAQLAAASTRITNDPALNSDQRLAALRALAADTRTRVRSTLGAAIGDAYLAGGASQFFTYLDRGSSFTFGNGGIERVSSPAVPTPPPR